MPSETPPRWAFALELALILCAFCIPLFVGLGRWDFHNDESIYSYAVDRIIETGDWLTPRSIPGDGPFLEKPPLKFWIVAAGITSGLLPHDEIGLRFWDALFGAIAFVYVFLFGWRIAGPGCGFIAVLLLFTLDSLLFEHGLRSNNMEAALVLSYCGGLYHFARWAESAVASRRHALAVGAFFALGFMTKFVAALFMPMIVLLAILWRADAWRRLKAQRTDWLAPAALVLAIAAPWFIYQTMAGGAMVWREMFGVHVYQRFTAALDPGHLQPWHAYFSWTWEELVFAGSSLIAAAGMVTAAVRAVAGHSWAARLIVLWFAVPFVLLSMTPSKVIHYIYPFWPAIAIAAGWVVVDGYRALVAAVERPVQRPARGMRVAVRAAVIAALAVLLPVRTYPLQAAHLVNVNEPLQALRDCVTAAIPGRQREVRVYVPYERLLNHAFYYYPRQIGPWRIDDSVDAPDLVRRLHDPGEQTLIIIARADYEHFARRTGKNTPAIKLSDDLILLTPGPFEICRRAALAAGGTDVDAAIPLRNRH